MDGAIHRHRPAGFLAFAPSVPYLIDATSSSTGRHFKPTKRRVEFRFGFASFPHLALGYQRHECRGHEHQVILLWSLLSGKRRVILDGRDVYFRHEANLSAQQFSHSFVIPGLNHNLQLVADYSGHIDLFIDGQSSFEMLRIYQLGGTECQRRYSHVYAYATRVPRAELEKALTMGTSHTNMRRLEQDDDGEVDSLSDDGDWENFTHLDPRNEAEEKKMYSMARQRSLRDGRSSAILRSSLKNIDECREEEVDLIDFSTVGSPHQPPFATAAPDDNVSVLGDDASSVGGWGTGPTFQVPSYVAAPPPTWEQMHGDFGGMNTAASIHPPSSRTWMHSQSVESSSVSGWGTGPNVPSFVNAPAPPTWEQTQRAFGGDNVPSVVNAPAPPTWEQAQRAFGGGNVPSVVNAPPPPPTWEQTQRAFGGGVPPPSSRTISSSNQPPSVAASTAGGWGKGPTVPFVINAPPPPTWEQTQAAFGWGNQPPPPPSVTSSLYTKY